MWPFSDSPLYDLLYVAFRTASGVFYSSFDVRGLSNVPGHGEATILCFNHGNSLTDSIALISHTPRVIRFCAKNTLWDLPIISNMIKMSGAVPVYRRREHGDKAAEFNKDMFSAVYKALLDHGYCVGFSPEGVSSFKSYSTEFKSGVAHIALEAVSKALEKGDESFKVRLLPAVMAWTHREKFRSDVLLRFRPPIVVDKSWLENGKSRKESANELIGMLEEEFKENMVQAPDWKIIKYAITATRIHRPLGTYMSLSTYMYLLRGWVEVLKLEKDTVVVCSDEKNKGKAHALTIGQVWDALETYQAMLDAVYIKDERIRRVVADDDRRPATGKCIRIIIYRAVVCTILFAVALPGLLIWSPVWFLIKRKERELLSRGIGWVDSVAENKMLVGFFSIIAFVLIFNVYSPLLLGYLWLTMRLFEEAVASARSICGIYRLMTISQDKLDTLIKLRKDAKGKVLQAACLFPKSSAERIMEECGDDVYDPSRADEHVHPPRWWTNFNPMRRRKKDWNELLRLSDYCTMDYV